MDDFLEWLGKYAPLIVSICAIAYTGISLAAARRHSKISVRPHLAVASDVDRVGSEVTVTWVLANNGLGPAFVDHFEVIVGDYAFVPHDYEEVLEALAIFMADASMIRDKCYALVVRKGHIMSKDSQVKIGTLVFHAPSKRDLQKLHLEVHLVIRYRSAYNEKFLYDTRAFLPAIPNKVPARITTRKS